MLMPLLQPLPVIPAQVVGSEHVVTQAGTAKNGEAGFIKIAPTGSKFITTKTFQPEVNYGVER